MKNLRWGILGTSFISGVLAKAIQETPGNTLLAIGSRDATRAGQFAAQNEVAKQYTDYHELLADSDTDVVYIGLPNHLHAEWAIAAAKAGKHILCEKPFAVNRHEAETVWATVREAKVFCMEAQMYRCHPLIARLIELMSQKPIGNLLTINTVFSDKFSDNANPTAGGSIMDLGCYPISLLRLTVGAYLGSDFVEPEIVGATITRGSHGNDHAAMALLKFPKNILANVTVSHSISLQMSLKICGDNGYIEVPNPWLAETTGNQILLKKDDAKSVEEIIVDSSLSLYATEVRAVSEAIAAGKTEAPHPAMTEEDTMANMRILDAWRKHVGLAFDCEKNVGNTDTLLGAATAKAGFLNS